MYFEKQLRIQYYDCDCNSTLKLSAAMRYMQQTSSEHLEHMDMSAEKLFAENMVFMLTKTCIKVHKMPVCSQEVVVGTVATFTKGVRFYREFVIKTTMGEPLLSALTVWVLVNTKDHKVLRPCAFPYTLPFGDTIIHGAIEDIQIPKHTAISPCQQIEIPIRYSHLDINHHVTNSAYGDFLCDALPYQKIISSSLDTVVLCFQNEAKIDEKLTIKTYRVTENEYIVAGLHNDATCFEAYAVLSANR